MERSTLIRAGEKRYQGGGHTEITPYDSITEISIFLAPV
jgi:hypothetical protein